MAGNSAIETGASSGVNELLARLREDGVAAGRKDALELVESAKAEAAKIRENANREAQALKDAAQKESEALRRAGQDALEAAIRDAILELKTQMTNRFRADVHRLVSTEMSDPEFLRTLIIELAGRTSVQTRAKDSFAVLLPEKALGAPKSKDDADEFEVGPLTDFVRGIAGDLVRDGVTFSPSPDFAAGARIFLEDDDVVIDLSDEAVSAMLGQHLQPRFRAILDGIVK
ncbi:MAG: hypothetical protein AAGH57_05060 [Pseudomonadota bacterium]